MRDFEIKVQLIAAGYQNLKRCPNESLKKIIHKIAIISKFPFKSKMPRPSLLLFSHGKGSQKDKRALKL